MAVFSTEHVAIRGISACVPADIQYNSKVYEKYGGGGYEQFVATTGVKQKRIASKYITSSDLCCSAAEKLMTDLCWKNDEIDVLIFVSQTPDYILPATSCILQERLGLSNNCYTLDISLGCSGWVYALSVIASLMQNGFFRKGLLLSGDTVLKLCSDNDKSTYPLFGDAGTCTALEFDENAKAMSFVMHTDGSGANAIIVKTGAARNRVTPESFVEEDYGEGIRRNSYQIEMDGISVFTFGISKASKVVNELLDVTDENRENIDIYSFHQANLFMNEKIRKKLKLLPEQVLYSMDEFGNTSCASIPLTLVVRRADDLRNKSLKHIGCGFGVGLSWGAVRFDTDNIIVPKLIEI